MIQYRLVVSPQSLDNKVVLDLQPGENWLHLVRDPLSSTLLKRAPPHSTKDDHGHDDPTTTTTTTTTTASTTTSISIVRPILRNSRECPNQIDDVDSRFLLLQYHQGLLWVKDMREQEGEVNQQQDHDHYNVAASSAADMYQKNPPSHNNTNSWTVWYGGSNRRHRRRDSNTSNSTTSGGGGGTRTVATTGTTTTTNPTQHLPPQSESQQQQQLVLKPRQAIWLRHQDRISLVSNSTTAIGEHDDITTTRLLPERVWIEFYCSDQEARAEADDAIESAAAVVCGAMTKSTVTQHTPSSDQRAEEDMMSRTDTTTTCGGSNDATHRLACRNSREEEKEDSPTNAVKERVLDQSQPRAFTDTIEDTNAPHIPESQNANHTTTVREAESSVVPSTVQPQPQLSYRETSGENHMEVEGEQEQKQQSQGAVGSISQPSASQFAVEQNIGTQAIESHGVPEGMQRSGDSKVEQETVLSEVKMEDVVVVQPTATETQSTSELESYTQPSHSQRSTTTFQSQPPTQESQSQSNMMVPLLFANSYDLLTQPSLERDEDETPTDTASQRSSAVQAQPGSQLASQRVDDNLETTQPSNEEDPRDALSATDHGTTTTSVEECDVQVALPPQAGSEASGVSDTIHQEQLLVRPKEAETTTTGSLADAGVSSTDNPVLEAPATPAAGPKLLPSVYSLAGSDDLSSQILWTPPCISSSNRSPKTSPQESTNDISSPPAPLNGTAMPQSPHRAKLAHHDGEIINDVDDGRDAQTSTDLTLENAKTVPESQPPKVDSSSMPPEPAQDEAFPLSTATENTVSDDTPSNLHSSNDEVRASQAVSSSYEPRQSAAQIDETSRTEASTFVDPSYPTHDEPSTQADARADEDKHDSKAAAEATTPAHSSLDGTGASEAAVPSCGSQHNALQIEEDRQADVKPPSRDPEPSTLVDQSVLAPDEVNAQAPFNPADEDTNKNNLAVAAPTPTHAPKEATTLSRSKRTSTGTSSNVEQKPTPTSTPAPFDHASVRRSTRKRRHTDVADQPAVELSRKKSKGEPFSCDLGVDLEEQAENDPPSSAGNTAACHVLVTSLKESLNRKISKMLADLGGVLIKDIRDAHQCTHLIASDGTSSLKRTPKLMIALNKTTNVVTLQWLLDSHAAGRLLGCQKYLILNDMQAEKDYKFKMSETLNRVKLHQQKGSSVLGERVVHVCQSVFNNREDGKKSPPPEDLRLIVEAAGGAWLSAPPKDLSRVDTKSLLIITNEDTQLKANQLKETEIAAAIGAGAKSKSLKWLLHCMMTQKYV